MIATAVTFLVLAATALVAQQKRIEKLDGQVDHLASALDQAQAQALEADIAYIAEATEHEGTRQALWEAGREAATHADHLEALLEATRETPSLRLVREQARPEHVVHVTAEPVAEDVVWCDDCEEWVASGAPEGADALEVQP